MTKFQFKNFKLNVFYLAWFIVAIFYFYQYILRVSPGIMALELRQTFHLNAQQFSSLGSIYLFSYALLQIPLGYILDQIGAKKLVMASIITCITGTIIFTYAQDVWMLQLGRFLIGLGSAPAFICALKIISDNLPERLTGFLMGVTLALGTLGALVSGKFLVSLLDRSGWQETLLVCAGLGFMLLIVVGVMIPASKKQKAAQEKTTLPFYQAMLNTLKQREVLIYGVIAICVYTPLCVLADLWGTTFLMEKYGLNRAHAAQLSLFLYGGLTLGSLTLPGLSYKWDKIREVLQFCAVGLLFSLGALLYANNLSVWQIALLLTAIGAFCGAEMICFAGATQNTSSSQSGLTLGIVNTANMLGGALVAQLIGWYLDFQWQGLIDAKGSRFYSAQELTQALSILLVVIFFCGLLTLKLTKNKQPILATATDG